MYDRKEALEWPRSLPPGRRCPAHPPRGAGKRDSAIRWSRPWLRV